MHWAFVRASVCLHFACGAPGNLVTDWMTVYQCAWVWRMRALKLYLETPNVR